ncbi:ABC transporter substrate-binding protein [Candidatus Halobeggiatoa sp. HSG11]|nr:ABC transporter substrate-binding protein [Candidatus Halobeggiatoa sp. HSG11]
MKPILVLIILTLLTACNEPQHNLRFGLSKAPISLDPRFATDATSSRINRLLYRQLVDFDDKLRPTPDLATWQQLTPTHYRFTLDTEGREFHNGMRLTAYDVKATYEFILDANNASPHRGSLLLINQIKVQDENTLDFILSKADILFPGRLVVGIMPVTLIKEKHAFNKSPVGSGKLKLLDWSQSGHLFLTRQSDGQVIEFLEVKKPLVRSLKLVRGEVDIIQNDLSPELLTWLKQRSEIKITKRQGSNFSYFAFNMQDSVTKQLAVREAIAYAINREEIIRYVLGDAARPASSFLLSSTHWAGHPGLPNYQYNPVKAKALLKQAGVEKPLKISYKTSNNATRIRIATVVKQQLSKVGIDMDLRTYDWGTFYGDVKAGRFQTYSLAWVGIKMPDIFRYVFHSSSIPANGGANRGLLNSPKIDRLIEQAEQASSLEDGAILYRALQKEFFKELPYIPLWYEDHVLATNQRVKGYTLAADGNYDSLISAQIIN